MKTRAASIDREREREREREITWRESFLRLSNKLVMLPSAKLQGSTIAAADEFLKNRNPP